MRAINDWAKILSKCEVDRLPSYDCIISVGLKIQLQGYKTLWSVFFALLNYHCGK